MNFRGRREEEVKYVRQQKMGVMKWAVYYICSNFLNNDIRLFVNTIMPVSKKLEDCTHSYRWRNCSSATWFREGCRWLIESWLCSWRGLVDQGKAEKRYRVWLHTPIRVHLDNDLKAILFIKLLNATKHITYKENSKYDERPIKRSKTDSYEYWPLPNKMAFFQSDTFI